MQVKIVKYEINLNILNPKCIKIHLESFRHLRKNKRATHCNGWCYTIITETKGRVVHIHFFALGPLGPLGHMLHVHTLMVYLVC